MYLAIGAFEDLSVNNRQADFPTQLRGYLTAAYQHSQITLLEREYVDILQQEMRLDLAGLTEEGGTNAPVLMQSAFWLVDGYYQSYETSRLELELGLNIEQIFGHTIVFGENPVTLRDLPGEPIFNKIKEEIDSAMSKNATVAAPTRFSEAGAQMEAGRELLSSVIRLMPSPTIFGWISPEGHNYVFNDSSGRAARNFEEAIRAFQTVLLLEPGNHQAKMYLAFCLREPSFGRVDEARNYYREIIEDDVTDQWSEPAQQALVTSFEYASPQEKIRWLSEVR